MSGERWPDGHREPGEPIDGMPLDREIEVLQSLQQSTHFGGQMVMDASRRIDELAAEGLWPQ